MMDYSETLRTTRLISATVSAADLKSTLITVVRKAAQIGDDANVLFATADSTAEGGLLVKIEVEQPAPPAAPPPAPAPAASAPAPAAQAFVPVLPIA